MAKSPKVPEHVLKKRKTQEAVAAQKAKDLVKARAENKVERKSIFKKAAVYAKEYKTAEKELVRNRREAKKHGNFYMEPEPKLVYVVRIKGINAVDPKTRKILQLMRLKQVQSIPQQINSGVFMKVNSASVNNLRLAGAYVTYGSPNVKTVRELIYKRGFACVNKQRLPLTDNSIIKENLGKYGITCMEDLVHEIATVGPNFKPCNQFLWPFKMSSAKGGLPKKRLHFVEGGQYGDREELINSLVRKMN